MTTQSIMIAEPDLIVAKSMERWLHNQGQSVIGIATTGNAILKEAGEKRPDLVLVNASLKDGMKGIDVARTLSGSFDVPSVLIAAFADDILRSEYQDAGIYGFLVKPFSEKNLHLAVGMALSRHRKERDVRQSYDGLKAVVATFESGVIATDASDRIVFMNPAAEELTGIDAGEAYMTDISGIFCPVKTGPENSLAEKSGGIIANGHPVEQEIVRTISKSGEKRVISHSVAIIHDETDRNLGRLHTLRDISRELEAEEEYVREQKLASLGVLAGGLAHELNNILTTMMGHLSLCRISTNDEPGRFHFDELESNIFSIQDVARQLLTFSPGGMPVRKVVSVAPIVTHAIESAPGTPKIRYDLQLPDDLWEIDVDENQIVLSIRNLLRNASQAMNGEGAIQVSACNRAIWNDGEHDKGPRRFVRVSVSDHGIGIGKEQLGKIFDPFVTTKPGSSGIGLAVVYSILKRHGGVVVAESDPGLGSTFHLLLPAADVNPGITRTDPL